MPIHGASLSTRTLSRVLVGLINIMIVVSYTGWENKTNCADSMVTSEITKDAAKSLFENGRGPKPRFQGTSVALEKHDLAR